MKNPYEVMRSKSESACIDRSWRLNGRAAGTRRGLDTSVKGQGDEGGKDEVNEELQSAGSPVISYPRVFAYDCTSQGRRPWGYIDVDGNYDHQFLSRERARRYFSD